MEVTVRTKNFRLGPGQEEQVRKRIERLTRNLPNISTAEVVISQQPTHLTAQRFHFVAQVTLSTRNGNLMRSEVKDPELLTAVDDTCAHLSRQITRFKSRYERRKRGSVGLGRTPVMDQEAFQLFEAPAVEEISAYTEQEEAPARLNGQSSGAAAEAEEEEPGTIVRVKGFSVKPMFPEDAVEQMELLGHDFFVFTNASDERVNVVYRRNDGNYGLIQPDFG